MRSADLLIFTTPNYCMMPSAPMKSFLDLSFTNWMAHKPYPEMFTKRAVVISTTAGSGAKKATKLIADNLSNWCIPKVTKYGVTVQAMNWNMVPQKIKDKIEKDMKKLTGVRHPLKRNTGKKWVGSTEQSLGNKRCIYPQKW